MSSKPSTYVLRIQKKWFKLDWNQIEATEYIRGWAAAADVVYNYTDGYFVNLVQAGEINEDQIEFLVWTYGGIENVPAIPQHYYPGGLNNG